MKCSIFYLKSKRMGLHTDKTRCEFEFVGEINGDACEENKRLPLALFNNAENRVVHLWRWIRYDSSA